MKKQMAHAIDKTDALYFQRLETRLKSLLNSDSKNPEFLISNVKTAPNPEEHYHLYIKKNSVLLETGDGPHKKTMFYNFKTHEFLQNNQPKNIIFLHRFIEKLKKIGRDSKSDKAYVYKKEI